MAQGMTKRVYKRMESEMLGIHQFGDKTFERFKLILLSRNSRTTENIIASDLLVISNYYYSPLYLLGRVLGSVWREAFLYTLN